MIGFEGYFDVIVIREDVKVIKFELKIFFYVFEKFGVELKEVVFVGDFLS